MEAEGCCLSYLLDISRWGGGLLFKYSLLLDNCVPRDVVSIALKYVVFGIAYQIYDFERQRYIRMCFQWVFLEYLDWRFTG